MALRRTLRGASPIKLLASLAAVTLAGIAAVAGTQAVLSDTTQSPDNRFDAGEINLADNGRGTFLYQVDDAEPGEPTEVCIRVSYTSTTNTDSTVKLYMGTPLESLGPYVDLQIEVGTQAAEALPTFPGCDGFVRSQGLYNGTLAGFHTTHGSDTSGAEYSPRGTNPWQHGDEVVYKMTLTLQSARPSGTLHSGPHIYTWHAEAV